MNSISYRTNNRHALQQGSGFMDFAKSAVGSLAGSDAVRQGLGNLANIGINAGLGALQKKMGSGVSLAGGRLPPATRRYSKQYAKKKRYIH